MPAVELSVYVSDDPEVLQVAVKLKVVEIVWVSVHSNLSSTTSVREIQVTVLIRVHWRTWRYLGESLVCHR